MAFPSSHNELQEIKQEAAADNKTILSYTMAMHDNFLLVTTGEEAKLLAISENFTTTPELISTVGKWHSPPMIYFFLKLLGRMDGPK
jgi:hypothetical protein